MKNQDGCEQIQRALRLRSTGTENPPEAVRLHLESCVSCSVFLAQLEALETQVFAWRNELPPAFLETRIQSALNVERVGEKERGSQSRLQSLMSLERLKEKKTMFRRLSWGVATLLATTILVASQQVGRAHTPLNRMSEAAKRVKTVHILGWNCELKSEITQEVLRGNTQINMADALPHRFEAWITEGHWRESQDFDVTLYHSGKVWKNGTLVSNETQPPLLTAFAFRAITGEDPFGKGVEFTAQAQESTLLEGKPANKLLIESQKQPNMDGKAPIQERRLFWLDPNTGLPLRMEQMHYNLDRWELDAVFWFQYDLAVSSALFDPAKVKAERHGQIDYAQPSAQTLYRMSNAQYAQYRTLLQDLANQDASLRANKRLSESEKQTMLVKIGAQNTEQIRRILDSDQQKLFNDWWYVLPKVQEKLSTPAQREEDMRWRTEQKALMNAWYHSLDERTQHRMGGLVAGN